VVIALLGILAALLLPALARAKQKSQQTACGSNLRQIGFAARLYMEDYNGELFHEQEDWVLDDGTQVGTLPTSLSGVSGGGSGNSHAKKPWVIFLKPYLISRRVAFCPADCTPHSRILATDLTGYSGGITDVGQTPPPDSEQAVAQSEHLSIESYALNSVFTHKSARYALEGALSGFATDTTLRQLADPNFIMFSERNCEALDAPDNAQYGSVTQDDYHTWVGEAALVRWGSGPYADEGWLRYNRHGRRANYSYTYQQVQCLPWSKARDDQFPDHRVRAALSNPPQ
jgi:hypothetical protein